MTFSVTVVALWSHANILKLTGIDIKYFVICIDGELFMNHDQLQHFIVWEYKL